MHIIDDNNPSPTCNHVIPIQSYSILPDLKSACPSYADWTIDPINDRYICQKRFLSNGHFRFLNWRCHTIQKQNNVSHDKALMETLCMVVASSFGS